MEEFLRLPLVQAMGKTLAAALAANLIAVVAVASWTVIAQGAIVGLLGGATKATVAAVKKAAAEGRVSAAAEAAEARDTLRSAAAEGRVSVAAEAAEARDTLRLDLAADVQHLERSALTAGDLATDPSPPYLWNGQDVQMLNIDEGVCFLVGIAGAFEGRGERIEIVPEGGYWWLRGDAGGDSVSAYARCWRFPAPG